MRAMVTMAELQLERCVLSLLLLVILIGAFVLPLLVTKVACTARKSEGLAGPGLVPNPQREFLVIASGKVVVEKL